MRIGDDLAGIEKLLGAQAVAGGAGAATGLASIEVRGAAAVANRARGFSRLDLAQRAVTINGAAGIVTLQNGEPFAVMGVTVRHQRIVEIDSLLKQGMHEVLPGMLVKVETVVTRSLNKNDLDPRYDTAAAAHGNESKQELEALPSL